MDKAPYNPQPHLISIKGKDYLPVAYRIAWLRAADPQATLITTLTEHDPLGLWAVFKAEITLSDGGSATGWGKEQATDWGDYLEKAETKAIGRALAALGFGTVFATQDFDEGDRIVDSPQRPARPAPQQRAVPAVAQDPAPLIAAGKAAASDSAPMHTTEFWRAARELGYSSPDSIKRVAELTPAEWEHAGRPLRGLLNILTDAKALAP
jgi:hypothetical protein